VDIVLIAIGLLAILGAVLLGWWIGGRNVAPAQRERDEARAERDTFRNESEGWRDKFNEAIVNLAAECKTAERVEAAEAALGQERTTSAQLAAKVAAFERGEEERQRAHETQLAQLVDLQAKLETKFGELAGKAVEGAHDLFLKRAEERFGHVNKQSEERLKALLHPVETTLKRYEDGLSKVEKERVGSYRELREAVELVRSGQLEVRNEAAKLVNALRAAPKTRGRWGEQQFKNLIEIAGLSGFVDFQEEVSVAVEDGHLRPDFVIRLPGDQQLVVDVKCSLEAYLQAIDTVDGDGRQSFLDDHARAIRTHADALAKKSYWDQFDKAPDFVIMYIPGDNFISAALEADLELWERAAKKRVIICGPSTFLPMARTVAGIWRQEKLAEEAAEIAQNGRELYTSLAAMAGHITRLGKNLGTANDAYNDFVGSLERNVLSKAKRFETQGLSSGTKAIESLPVVDITPRPLTKLAPGEAEEAAE